jgi:hypothetical protein
MSKDQNQDKRFRDAYAKELAKALLDNERKHQQNCIGDVGCNAQDIFSKEDVENAYLSLCYDHPELKNDRVCIQLANTILNSFHSLKLDTSHRHTKGTDHGGSNQRTTVKTNATATSLGLCNRFVQGILEMATRHSHNVGGITSSNNNTSTIATDEVDYTKPYSGESLVLSDSTGLSAGRNVALLAFACFVKGPLYCCKILQEYMNVSHDHGFDFGESMAKGYSAIQTFLGSYEGRSMRCQDISSNGDIISSKESHLESTTSNRIDISFVSDDKSTQKSKEESVAILKENDPYVNETDNDSLKEIFAAESDPDDYDYGDDRYNDLHEEENLSHEFKSFSVSWDAKVLSEPKILTLDEMIQRVESLLSELAASIINLGNKEWKDWDAGNQLVSLTLELLLFLGHEQFDSLGTKFNKPLLALRDFALDSSHNCAALDSYLKLIHTLLRSEPSSVGAYASNNKKEEGELSPARCIGLSSLADLCSNQNIVTAPSKTGIKEKVKRIVMECVDELVECVAFVRPKDKNVDLVDRSPAWLRVSTMMSQILDFMTGMQSRSDCSPLSSHLVAQVTALEARGFLQSGLFRELILLYMCTETTKEDLQLVQKTSSLKVVVGQQLLQTILFLSSQSEILRSYVARVPEFTNIIYSGNFDHAHVAEGILWHSLLANVASVNKAPQVRMKGVVMVSSNDLTKRSRHNFLKLCAQVVEVKSNDVSVAEFLRLCTYCHHIPFLAECWSSAMRSERDSGDVRAAICEVLKALPQENTVTKLKVESKSDHPEKLHANGINSVTTCASVRKGCKHLLSFLEMVDNSNQAAKTNFSSKID